MVRFCDDLLEVLGDKEEGKITFFNESKKNVLDAINISGSPIEVIRVENVISEPLPSFEDAKKGKQITEKDFVIQKGFVITYKKKKF